MFANHYLSTYEGYPHGVICKCGLVLHMRDDEVIKPIMHVICPHCEHVTTYITSHPERSMDVANIDHGQPFIF